MEISWEKLIDRCHLFTGGHKGTLKNLLKEAEREMVRNCDILEKTYETIFTGQTPKVALPGDYKKPIAIWVDGRQLKPISEADVYRNSDHTVNTGTPYGFFVKENFMYFDKIPNTNDNIRMDYYATLNESANLQTSLPIVTFLREDEDFSTAPKYTNMSYDWIYYSLNPQVVWNVDETASSNTIFSGSHPVLPNIQLTRNTTTGGITGATFSNSSDMALAKINPASLNGLTGTTDSYYGGKYATINESNADYFITGGGSGAKLTFNSTSMGVTSWRLDSITVASQGTGYGKLKVAVKSDSQDLSGATIKLKRKYAFKNIHETSTSQLSTPTNPNGRDSNNNVPLPSHISIKLSGNAISDSDNGYSIFDFEYGDYEAKENEIIPDDGNGSNNMWGAKSLTPDTEEDDAVIDLYSEYYPSIPSQYHLSLCDYAIALINAKDNPDLHNKHMGLWVANLEQVLKEDADRDLPHSIRGEI